MKKKISLILLVVTLLSCFYQVSAEKVGDVVNKALYTDIVAYINHNPINSYNVDGYTAIVVEDLVDYGFNVVWDGNSKTLKVTSNDSVKAITPKSTVYKTPDSLIDQTAAEVLYTDIKTYVNGKEVRSYNINGRTIVYFKDLSPFGKVAWDESTRSAKMWIEKLPIAVFNPPQVMDSNVASMFVGYWTDVTSTVGWANDIEISDVIYNNCSTKKVPIYKYNYKIISAMQDNPSYTGAFGSGYYLDINTYMNILGEVSKDVLSRVLLYIPLDETTTMYKRATDGSNVKPIDLYTVKYPSKLTNTDKPAVESKPAEDVKIEKPAENIAVGDTVTVYGYINEFVGTVQEINGDNVLVYWYDLIDISYGQSIRKKTTAEDIGMSELVSGAKLDNSTWHVKSTLHKR